ncbi:hypothetical protein C1645_823654 [Glomus cerebriforme]|uniref:Uncharacterized protein n=1 Tax=Glomus cerebriforme TaxID=658196 RepID=A0A397SW52_9GLOM|nr:hypothetical protein C1645_823654 [Glomus cerebriforme]
MSSNLSKNIARVSNLKKHLTYDCNKVDSNTKISVLMMLMNNCEDSEDDSNTTSTTRSKLNRAINEENNLTIAFDRWMNSTGQSIYDYYLITEERREYLWYSKNYSDVPHHTGAFLGNELIKIVNDIGSEKLVTVVSDNMPDTYAITILQIKGGRLKSHTKTRWSTMWDCIISIVRLELAFARETTQNTKEEWKLQALALWLFSITPHSASYEYSFSILGWFYELPYYAINTSENLLREKMINTIIEISNKLLGEEDFEFLYDENVIDMVIDIFQTYNLNVILDVDIEFQIFNMERRESENETTVNQRRQTVILDPECEDYDIEALIAREMNNDNEL